MKRCHGARRLRTAGLALLLLSAGCDAPGPLPSPPPGVAPTSRAVPSCAATAPVPATSAPEGAIVLAGHTGPVTTLAWSPDGRLLASASGDLASAAPDSTVRLWRADGSPAGTLRGASGPVFALAWSPDGQTLAAGSGDGIIRLWGVDGALRRAIAGGAGTVFALAWAPDGQMLAAGASMTFLNPTVQLWRPDGALLRTMHTDHTGGKFYNLAWSPDGRWLAGGAVDYKLWRADGSEVAHPVAGSPAWALAWAPDSRHWATGDESGAVDIYDTTGHEERLLHNGGNVDSLAWSPDGATLAGGDGVTFWRAADGVTLRTHAAVSFRANSVAWAPDGALLASGGSDGAVQLWRADGLAAGMLLGHTAAVLRVAWAPEGAVLATASADGTARLWRLGPPPPP
jgi:WD40 repeat protein